MMGSEELLPRLVRKYLELSDVCYRVAVAVHDERGRFRRGHRGRRPHPALLKKVDLDHELARIYRRFFGPPEEPSSISTSKSRRQGRETESSGGGSSSRPASRSE
jgi:hypothetical protein